MMEDLFDILTMAPVWVGPTLAALSFPILRYLIPYVLSGKDADPMAVGYSLIATFVRMLGLFVPAMILLAWAGAEFKKWVNRRRFDMTNSIEDIRRMSWREFELLVAEAFRRRGFEVEDVNSPSGDGGIDLVLHSSGERTLVQCKQWKARSVGVKVVRELYGVMNDRGASRGIIACCGHYTNEASDFAERNGITLITGRDLERLISEVKSSQPSQPDRQTEAVPVAVTPSTAHTDAAPLCPVCGRQMILKTARKGRTPGSQFWGCPQFPKCRGMRPTTAD